MMIMIKRIHYDEKGKQYCTREIIDANNIEYAGDILMPEQKKNLIEKGNTVIAYDLFKQLTKEREDGKIDARKLLNEVKKLVGFVCEYKIVGDETDGYGVILTKRPKYILLVNESRYSLFRDGELVEYWTRPYNYDHLLMQLKHLYDLEPGMPSDYFVIR